MRVHQAAELEEGEEGEEVGRQLLERWVERGLIQQDQADRIRGVEGWQSEATSLAAPAVASRGSLIVEALGYLGGVLIVVAAALITSWYWADIPTWGRVALPLAAAALLAVAGWLAYRRPSERTARLRGAGCGCGGVRSRVRSNLPPAVETVGD